MLNLQVIVRQALSLQDGKMDTDDFFEWYADYSVGNRGAKGNRVADALAAVDMVIAEFSLGEIEPRQLGEKVREALHPFEHSADAVLTPVYGEA